MLHSADEYASSWLNWVAKEYLPNEMNSINTEYVAFFILALEKFPLTEITFKGHL